VIGLCQPKKRPPGIAPPPQNVDTGLSPACDLDHWVVRDRQNISKSAVLALPSEDTERMSGFIRICHVLFFDLIPWYCGLRFGVLERKLSILEIPMVFQVMSMSGQMSGVYYQIDC
jgi:hypothetical protein